MKKQLVPGILILSVSCIFIFAFRANKQEPDPITLTEFNKKIANKNKIVLVYFNANWCAVCAKMKPVIEQAEAEYGAKMEVLKIDTDRDKEVASEFEIDALPVLILYKNGKREWISVGLIDKVKLKSTIESY